MAMGSDFWDDVYDVSSCKTVKLSWEGQGANGETFYMSDCELTGEQFAAMFAALAMRDDLHG